MEPQTLVQAGESGIDFETLLAEEQPRLLRLARRLVWDIEESRDLVQASLADAYERRRSLRDAAAAPGWLRRVLVHRAMSHLRRRRVWQAVQQVLHLEPRPAAPPEASPEALLERAQEEASLSRAVDRLPVRQATAFTLRYLEGMSVDEVAAAMEIDRGTVRIHLQRALAKVRALVPPARTEP